MNGDIHVISIYTGIGAPPGGNIPHILHTQRNQSYKPHVFEGPLLKKIVYHKIDHTIRLSSSGLF